MKTRLLYGWLCALLCSWLAAGCSGSLRARPFVEARDALFVAPPEVPSAVDSALAPLGWAPGRFASELRKELRYQLNKKGVATPEDSAAAKARLDVRIDHYDTSGYGGIARLTTAGGERDIDIKRGKRVEEREDPTIDYIRIIAGNLAEAVRTDPRHQNREDAPPLMLIPL